MQAVFIHLIFSPLCQPPVITLWNWRRETFSSKRIRNKIDGDGFPTRPAGALLFYCCSPWHTQVLLAREHAQGGPRPWLPLRWAPLCSCPPAALSPALCSQSSSFLLPFEDVTVQLLWQLVAVMCEGWERRTGVKSLETSQALGRNWDEMILWFFLPLSLSLFFFYYKRRGDLVCCTCINCAGLALLKPGVKK